MKKIVCFILLVYSIMLSALSVNALGTGFETQSMTDDRMDDIISGIELVSLKDEPYKKAVLCFDVNNDGKIAIGQYSTDRKTVCVYTDDGVYQYGFSFNTSGDFALEWNGNDLNIYFVRGSFIVSVTENGEIIDVAQVTSTIENNSYKNRIRYATEKSIGDKRYTLENDMGIMNWFSSTFSQVTVNENGTEWIVYDASASKISNTIVASVIVFICLAVAITVIIWNVKKVQNTTYNR